MKTDLRFGFGDNVQATVATTDNSLKTRTEGCIALLSTGNPTGSVLMLHLATNRVVTRDQFKVLPMPDLVVEYLTATARKEGDTRAAVDPGLVHFPDTNSLLPTQIAIDGRADIMQPRISLDAAGVHDASTIHLDELLPIDAHQLDQEVEQIEQLNSISSDADASDSTQVRGVNSTAASESAQIGGVDTENSQVGGAGNASETVDTAWADESDPIDDTRQEDAESSTGDTHRYPTRYAAGSILEVHYHLSMFY